ncbi:hypothetical protein [Aliiglaciecola sp. LCG003]|uniref:hypothetical protein n=1 Tax=Aliiglaciecola sp. LCG003 TaxID=3053655 RepID=UPI002574653E|nr:hypothetical protein [Aliiglaciecola sp. LCG003]WJG08099.1 hypothetical protein QR722_12165 [Aliiglaciecola sp. LCG003]
MSIYRTVIMNLFFTSLVLMASDKPSDSTDEQWNKYLEHKASRDKMLEARYNNELKHNPPKPPWIKYPNRHPTDIFWRMGNGEDYLVDYFGLYFKYASVSETKAYMLKYPEHKDWLGTYESIKN